MKNRLLLLFFCIIMIGSLPARSPSLRTGLLVAAAAGTGGVYGGLKLLRRRAARASLAAAQERSLTENDRYWLQVNHKLNTLEQLLKASGLGASGLTAAALISLLLDARGQAASPDDSPVLPAPQPIPSPSPIIPSPAPPPAPMPPAPAPPVDPIDIFRVKEEVLSAEQRELATTINEYADRVKGLQSLAEKMNKATGAARTQFADQIAQERKDLMAQQEATYQEIIKLPENQQHKLIEALNGDHQFGAFETKAPPVQGWQDKPVDTSSQPSGVRGSATEEKAGEVVRARFNAALQLNPVADDLSAVSFFTSDEIDSFPPFQQERARIANFELARKHMERALHQATLAKEAGNAGYQEIIAQAAAAYDRHLRPGNPSRALADKVDTFALLFARKRQQLDHTPEEWAQIEAKEKQAERVRQEEHRKAHEERRREREARNAPSADRQAAVARLIARHHAEQQARQAAAYEEQQRLLWQKVAELEQEYADNQAERMAAVNDYIAKHEAAQKERGISVGVGIGTSGFFPTEKAIAAEMARHTPAE